MHQAAWFRILVPILGAGVLPAAAVSAGALFGLALGSVWGGRRSDRNERPARTLASAELFAALTCAAFIPVTRVFTERPAESSLGADALWLLLATGVCAAAAAPMGATLPAALRVRSAAPRATGAAFRRLYGWNTIGAVAGVLVAVGWLLEMLGNVDLIVVAALMQLAVAVGAFLLFRSARRPARRQAEPARVRPGLAWAAAVAGAAGLAVQVAWVRRLTPVVGNTTYAFGTVLGTYLIALALGVLLFGPRRGRGGTHGPLIVLMLAAVPVAVLPEAIGRIAAWTGGYVRDNNPSAADLLWIRTAAAGCVLVPSTLLGAAALPWLLRAAAPDRTEAGGESGWLLGMNTLGSGVCALLTGLLWLPAVGSAAVLRGAAGLYLLAALPLMGGKERVALAAIALALLVQPVAVPLDDTVMWDSVGATFSTEFHPEDAPRRFAREGRVSTVVVRDREGRPELWVDSKIVASAQPTDRLHLALLGHLPMALHPDPKRVAVIGLGTGITAQGVASWHPDVLDIYELEPAVEEAAALFVSEGGGVPPRANVIHGDGRRAFARDVPYGDLYDVVTTDPIHPGVAGSAALYSADHYDAMRDRAPIVCQWLPLYQLMPDDVRLIVRTFIGSFRYAYAFLAGPDAVLIGTRQPLAVDEAALRERMSSPAGAKLAAFGLDAPGRLLGLLVRGPEQLRSFAGNGPVNTDDRLILEFSAGRHWYVQEQKLNARLLRMGRANAPSLLRDTPSDAFRAELRQAKQFHDGMRAWLAYDRERALHEFGALARAQPRNTFARGLADEMTIEIAAGIVEHQRLEAFALLDELLRRPDLEPRLRLDVAQILIDAGETARGQAVARAVAAEADWPRAKRLSGR